MFFLLLSILSVRCHSCLSSEILEILLKLLGGIIDIFDLDLDLLILLVKALELLPHFRVIEKRYLLLYVPNRVFIPG